MLIEYYRVLTSLSLNKRSKSYKHNIQLVLFYISIILFSFYQARLAQLVERKALNLVVVGSSPTVGVFVKTMTFFFSLKQVLNCVVLDPP